MKKACLILLLLAGCGSKPGSGNEAEEPPAVENPLANLQLPTPEEEAARAQALAARALPSVLPNAKEARYRNVRPGSGGSACGEVAAKGTTVFRPFVVTPEGVAVVGETPRIAFEDPSDFLADAYIRWCATPEELAHIAPQLKGPPPGAPLNEVTAALPPPVPPESLPEAPVTPAPKAAPSRPAPPPQIDSFFNSVQHKGQ